MKKILPVFLSLSLTLLSSPITSAGSLYDDVYDSHPVVTALEYLTNKGVVEGYGDGTFRPLDLINRAEFTKMVVEGVEGITPNENEYQRCFDDVEDEWYAKYVCYAKEQGWVGGYSDGGFHPKDNITLSEALKIVSVAMDWSLSIDESYFWDIDLSDSSQWYAQYVMMAEERDVLDKYDYRASPHELIRREQMAEMLYRSMKERNGETFAIWEPSEKAVPATYSEVLATGIQPAFPPDMPFVHHNQSGWPYGCYTFATKNLVEWKYDVVLDVAEVQQTIGWDGEFIWTDEEFDAFAEAYDMDVIFTYDASPQFVFDKLAMGEPLVAYIPLYQDIDGDGDEENIGHNLVLYSFDDESFWAADSIYPGSQHRVGFDEVFWPSARNSKNITQIRQVKGGGLTKNQSGL